MFTLSMNRSYCVFTLGDTETKTDVDTDNCNDKVAIDVNAGKLKRVSLSVNSA